MASRIISMFEVLVLPMVLLPNPIEGLLGNNTSQQIGSCVASETFRYERRQRVGNSIKSNTRATPRQQIGSAS